MPRSDEALSGENSQHDSVSQSFSGGQANTKEKMTRATLRLSMEIALEKFIAKTVLMTSGMTLMRDAI